MHRKRLFQSILNTIVALICSFSLAFTQTNIAAVAQEPMPTHALADRQTVQAVNTESFSMTSDSVTFGDTTITKKQIIESLGGLRRIGRWTGNSTSASQARSGPLGWEGASGQIKLASLGENSSHIEFDSGSASALMSLGQGVRSVYARILFALTIGEHAGEIWTLETAGYRLFIFCASQGMVINGFSVSYSWLTEVLLEQMLSPSSNHPIGAEKTPEEANDVINDDILDGATYDGIHDNVEQ